MGRNQLEGHWRKGWLLWRIERGRWALASERKRRVLRHPDLAAVLVPLAHTLLNRGGEEKISESVELFREVLEIRRYRLGESHLETSAALMNLALALHARGDSGEAVILAREAYDTRRQQHGERDLRTQDAALVLARTLDAEMTPEAEKLRRASLAVRRELLPPTHSQVFHAVIEMGEWLEEQQAFDQAVEHYEESLRMATGAWPARSWRRAEIAGRLGAAFSQLKRFTEAEPLLLGSLEVAQAAWPPGTKQYDLAVNRIINHYEAAGDPRSEEYRKLLSRD